MFLEDNWTYLLELKGDPPLAEKGAILVNLSSEDDWGDIELEKSAFDGTLRCFVGKPTDDEPGERREVVGFHKYVENEPFNYKFPMFKLVSIVDFARTLLDANQFYGIDDDEIAKMKEHYGV